MVIAKVEALIAAQAGLAGIAGVLADGAARTPGFEADLRYFLGEDWKARVEDYATPGVKDYVHHLEDLARERPELLVPYAYHLHMGMLSGGQILRNTAKRAMQLPKSGEGTEMFVCVYQGKREGGLNRLKSDYKAAGNALGGAMDDAQIKGVLRESINCFKMNNKIVSELPWGVNAWDLYSVLPFKYQGYVKAVAAGALAVVTVSVTATFIKYKR